MEIHNKNSTVNHMVFLCPPASSSSKGHPTRFRISLGAAYIIAYLREKGFNAAALESPVPITVRQCVNRLLAVKPKIVGFTVYQANYGICQLIARGLKEIDPAVIIVFGGPTPTAQGQTVLEQNPAVDICVVNEGEDTTLELLSLLDDVHFRLENVSLETVKGIVFRSGETIVKTPRRGLLAGGGEITDPLDKFPSPYLSGVISSPSMGVISARGCNQYCVYCNCASLSRRHITTHSVDRVIRELDYISKHLYRQDINTVDIMDDAFTLMPSRAVEICDNIIENKIKVPLICMTRCDCIDEVMLDKLKEAGFQSIGFALESAVPRVLRMIGKLQPPHIKPGDTFEKEREFIEQFKRYVSYAKKIGFKVVYTSIMLGLPTETPEEGRQTIDLLRSLEEKLDFYAHNALSIYPGTPLFYNHEKYGFKLQPLENRIHYKTLHPYDISQVEVPEKPRSTNEEVGKERDNLNLRSMSLPVSPEQEKRVNHVKKVIFCGDIITRELILWLQDHLVVNGDIIQIYSDFHQAREHCRYNQDALINYCAPTNTYTDYYQAPHDSRTVTFIPYRVHMTGKRSGFTIHRVDTQVGLSRAQSSVDPMHSLCFERNKADSLCLYELLDSLSPSAGSVQDIVDMPVYPYFAALCRWEDGEPNCRTLETVIVDAGHNVFTCWNGQPVGSVGMPLQEIVGNIEARYKETLETRNCRGCLKQEKCAACIFPYPLPEEEYCRLRKQADTEAAARLIRTVELYK
ncbi:MAG: radical SAM protein [Candidatus Aminicenantes bacterium]|nr:radical SAM protein [Candidatus Aminicenantes bacterium]NIM82860.1 radical SAM protein [Candidatus Aminicenantes bacterium]NIN22236.1 radical SAM protein [Candidatus Aminicenantes bacterium]NIN46004.1 radical SAM protein [Candidatus Aminicenantes bacterium]NIN88840.1 radical SAM protein [Candidatus Aminicenantes bacterium]